MKEKEHVGVSARAKAKDSGEKAAEWAAGDLEFARHSYELPDEMPDELVIAYAKATTEADELEQASINLRERVQGYDERWGVPEKEPGDNHEPSKPPLLPVSFPVDVLPSAAADAARAYAASIGCDVGFIAAPMLGVLVGAVANSYRVAIKDAWEEPACAWIAVVAQSGSGKSPGLNAAALPVYKLESEARRAYEAEREEHEQAMELWSALPRDERGPKPTPPKRRRVRTSDPTLESLGMLLGENERGLVVIRDEGGGFIAGMNQYKGGRGADVAGYVEMWGALPLVIDRKSGDVPVIYVERPNATLVLGVQPRILSELLTPEMVESGFLPLLLLVAPPERALRFTDADVTTEVREAYDKLIRTMYARSMGLEDPEKPDGPNVPTVLKLSPEARALFGAFVNENAELYGPLSGPLRSACVKLPPYAARFALAFHVANTPEGEEPGSIPEGMMVRAIRLMRWFRYESARLYLAYGFASSAPGDRDHRLAASLPENFTVDDVARLWEVKSSAAYDTIGRLISRGLAEDSGRGSYRRLPLAALDLTGWTPELPEEEEETSGVIPVIPVIPASGNGIPPTGRVPPFGFGTGRGRDESIRNNIRH